MRELVHLRGSCALLDRGAPKILFCSVAIPRHLVQTISNFEKRFGRFARGLLFMGRPLFLCRANRKILRFRLLIFFNPQRLQINTYCSHLLLNKWRGWWANLVTVFCWRRANALCRAVPLRVLLARQGRGQRGKTAPLEA